MFSMFKKNQRRFNGQASKMPILRKQNALQGQIKRVTSSGGVILHGIKSSSAGKNTPTANA